MSVTTLNPFDLLNEDAVPKTTIKKTLAAAPVAVAAPAKAAAAKPAVAAVAASATNARNSKGPSRKSNNSAELNANVNEKTPLRRGNNNRRPATETDGTERQERRRTDRHSRTGYKQDGEKRMTAGKGSWGKAVEQGEEHVTVNESVAIAEAIEGVEIVEESATEAVPAEVVVPHLTLAQYQATLKKPVVSASTSTRKVTTTHAKDQILKKETEVFVFPEIVKKSAAPVAAKKTEKAAGVDLSKYISVKAVSSVEPRTERTNRPESSVPRNVENRRSSGNNRTSTTNKRDSTTSTTTSTPSASKMNLNDNRSFPTLGSN